MMTPPESITRMRSNLIRLFISFYFQIKDDIKEAKKMR